MAFILELWTRGTFGHNWKSVKPSKPLDKHEGKHY
jgi:hypothetical protein